MGVMRGYLCERCPLAFEIGGYAYWSLEGRCEQTVCTACGTMHRLNETKGICQVTALPGPVRCLPLVTRKSAWGDASKITDYEWQFTDADWEAVGIHLGGIESLGQLACSRCGEVGRIQSLESPPNQVVFNGLCPLCERPIACLYHDTVN